MKKILLFVMEGCPYCHQALAWQKELMAADPRLAGLTVQVVDENRQAAFARTFDYYYVPTYFVEGHKVHEGVATREKVAAALYAALE